MPKQLAMVILSLGLYGGRLLAQAAPRVVLLELFTSEGCSSCPPADALLKQLNGTRTAAGDLVVGISEHVTYWNQLGWRDPFSTDVSTDRQSAYGRRFGLGEVYTPQMVVNGEQEVLGSDPAAVAQAFSRLKKVSAVSVQVVGVKAEGDGMALTFRVSAGTAKVDIYAVVAEDAASSRVARGENAGRTLAHVAVASTFVKVATASTDGEKTVHVAGVPAREAGTGKRHMIVFAQSAGLGPVLAVDTLAF